MKRGFAAMDPKLVVELARKGGIAAQAGGTAHRFSSEEARIAGRKGGLMTKNRKRFPKCGQLTCRRCHGNPGNTDLCGPNAAKVYGAGSKTAAMIDNAEAWRNRK